MPRTETREHPPFLTAVIADARVTSARRGKPVDSRSKPRILIEAMRLAWESDGFAAQMLYRARARMTRRGIPVLPGLLRHLASMLSGIRIGEQVLIRPGVQLAHGQIVIDGASEIMPGAVIYPHVTIEPAVPGGPGPRVGRGALVGTGARLIGPITVGDEASIGANAVIDHDVPAGSTVSGVPAGAPAP